MQPYTVWDALKDFLGAFGSVLVAIPWLYDFYLRNRRKKVQAGDTEGEAEDWKDYLDNSLKKKIDDPKKRDMLWTVIGLACICVSFLIAFVKGIWGS
jgi:hypothetical protein